MEGRAHSVRNYRSRIQTFREDRDPLFISQNRTSTMNGTANKMVRRALPKGQVPHICIVGAGIAGLRCAAVLSERGLRVTILEGRDRIGGRVSASENEKGSKLTIRRCTKVAN